MDRMIISRCEKTLSRRPPEGHPKRKSPTRPNRPFAESPLPTIQSPKTKSFYLYSHFNIPPPPYRLSSGFSLFLSFFVIKLFYKKETVFLYSISALKSSLRDTLINAPKVLPASPLLEKSVRWTVFSGAERRVMVPLCENKA